jgi:AI-2 transport protein TqsA
LLAEKYEIEILNFMQSPSLFKPLLILTCAAVLLTVMHLAAVFLTPILLAGFFAMLLTPLYRWLKQKRVPGGLALLLTLGFLVVVVWFLILLVGNSMTALAEDLSSYSDQFSQRLAELSAQAQSLDGTGGLQSLVSGLSPSNLVGILTSFVGAIAGVLRNSFIILLVIAFVLAEGSSFIRRLRQSFGADHFLPKNVTALARLMISYFGLRAIVNLVVATATGLMFWLVGIPHAGLWAVLTFFLSFIPYIGAFVAGIPPVLLAFAQGGLGLALVVVVLMILINTICENIVAPMIMGRGLSISPTVVFLSFLFWMFILGGSGALIAMPLTLGVILFMRSFEETRNLVAAVVIVPEGEPVQEARKA